MDIKELDKKQLVLLTLLITFVVSIATGIVTVSLMNQMPKSVPQTINNVIQRTIEKVTTVQVPAPETTSTTTETKTEENNSPILFGSDDSLVSIYLKNTDTTILTTEVTDENTNISEPPAIGQGIIISDVGLILVDSNLIKEYESYKVILDTTEFSVSILKKFDNGFTILKISPMIDNTTDNTDTDTTTITQ
ncbi:MAG: hypothetical protein WC603_00190 [Candidatus Paceibacterota bacterium]|jgi:hypothetical protein